MIQSKHAYYYGLKTAARTIVVQDFLKLIEAGGPGISTWHGMVLGSIDTPALEHAKRHWPKYYSEETHSGFSCSWESLHRKFRPIPSFFDLAVWQRVGPERFLQGLALGKPSDGKTHLTINWVERSFAPTYMKGGILLPVLACAEEYARLLGCKRVLIKNPVEPSKYARYGYETYRLRRVSAAYVYKEL